MGPLFIILFLAIVFGSVIAFASHLQKKETARFEVECREKGWKKIPQNNGYDIIPENDEKWQLISRRGNPNTPSSIEWSHPFPAASPLIIIPKSGLALLNEIPVKGVQLLHPEIFKDTTQLSLGSENFRKRYSVYGISGTENHPFLSGQREACLMNYLGADFVLVLFPDRLEIRLRDRNVQSQIPPLIRLGQQLIPAHSAASE